MKYLLLFVVINTQVAFADDYTFVNHCKTKAIKDLKSMAQSLHQATLDDDTVYVSEIDDRWYNPSKYIWFKGQAKKANGELVQVANMYQVSKKDLKKCDAPLKFTAPSDKKFVQECAAAGEKNLQAQAEREGLNYEEKSLEVTEVDDRIYNPFKYVWVKAKAKKASGQVVVLTSMLQKSFLPPRPCGGTARSNSAPTSSSAKKQSAK